MKNENCSRLFNIYYGEVQNFFPNLKKKKQFMTKNNNRLKARYKLTLTFHCL